MADIAALNWPTFRSENLRRSNKVPYVGLHHHISDYHKVRYDRVCRGVVTGSRDKLGVIFYKPETGVRPTKDDISTRQQLPGLKDWECGSQNVNISGYLKKQLYYGINKLISATTWNSESVSLWTLTLTL